MRFRLFTKIWSRIVNAEPSSPSADFLNSYAESVGYFLSVEVGVPIDQKSDPTPWFTYSSLEFLSQIDKRGLSVFEFGTGYSTLYWQNNGAAVYGAEHNPDWYSMICTKIKDCSGVKLFTTKEDYSLSIAHIGIQFDVIVIDGIWRNECAKAAIQHLSSEGIIILDNSDWYVDVVEYLDSLGLVRVDFSGPGPINNYSWTTSIFFHGKSVLSNRLGHPIPTSGISVDVVPDTW
jgi:hypothetical protein